MSEQSLLSLLCFLTFKVKMDDWGNYISTTGKKEKMPCTLYENKSHKTAEVPTSTPLTPLVEVDFFPRNSLRNVFSTQAKLNQK